MNNNGINARVTPKGNMDILSRHEVNLLRNKKNEQLQELFRRCALAVLNCGSLSDDGESLLEKYKDFEINVIQQPRGIKLDIKNAPESAFVDGYMIQGINNHLFSVVRDIIYTDSVMMKNTSLNLKSSEQVTNFIFHLLRNANLLKTNCETDIVVCWGGHSIKRNEYEYTKEVGYQLGLRALNICTGCGPGAMKGPMKGAAVGHAKQRHALGRYIGVTEPGIIAAESPNPIVNELTILPDIEKRLEAFVRLGHGIIVFPGGVGTAEEILYILGVLMHPKNKAMPYPLVLTGPESSRDYFEMIDTFIGQTLGTEAQVLYKIIIDDPESVAKYMKSNLEKVKTYRRKRRDAYYYNWLLKIDPIFQKPFEPTHALMANLDLHKDQEPHQLAANLRCAFSGIVAGNVKAQGLAEIKKHGPFQIAGDPEIMLSMDKMLRAFVDQGRMKLPGSTYKPCYRIVNK
ncbi:LOG family protein [Oleiphilus sp. HI0009]|nr:MULTISPECIES: nucleotide 5'-monophosphate nucleosidase PpnN [unclassified Oleiphilus]KZX83215.1 LOG family protein [Oleiphilus sp. HI0009]KZY62707.1 LOG family protein [Oleiphilus sp. HI0066]KZY68511.1 LOG family protein [Oleiphilus sp. HI0067]KZZ57320.1 LOG family protein [Oleiphilus sp. HI0125]